jgi:ubiquinone/menaquinone biosynthesis C-methylase UbiE
MTNSARIFETRSQDSFTEVNGVRKYFESVALFWRDIYRRHDVNAVIHQERRAAVLSLVDNLPIPPRSEVLEIGCGAGLTAVALAERGHSVKATDLAPPMLALTRCLADESGVGPLVKTQRCDTHDLPFPNASFTLVLAIGVLPWLSSLDAPMREMVRVLRPGGFLIVTTDNRWRLIHVVHPFAWARLVGIRIPDGLRFWKRSEGPLTTSYPVREFDSRLASLGLEKVTGATLGFGPFWLLHRLLPQAFSVKLHHGLQRSADRGVPLLRSAGAQYITLSRKAG